MAVEHSKFIQEVKATDLSGQQVSHAINTNNIKYEVARVEDIHFEQGSLDLITVVQALHWLN